MFCPLCQHLHYQSNVMCLAESEVLNLVANSQCKQKVLNFKGMKASRTFNYHSLSHNYDMLNNAN